MADLAARRVARRGVAGFHHRHMSTVALDQRFARRREVGHRFLGSHPDEHKVDIAKGGIFPPHRRGRVHESAALGKSPAKDRLRKVMT